MGFSFADHLRLALRRMVQAPSRAFAGVVTLGLGIGASTAAFSAVQSVLLEPLPVASQDDLAVLWLRSQARDFDHFPFLPAGLDAVSELPGIFTGVAAVETVGARPALGEASDGTFAIDHVRVGGDFFGVLGTSPTLGRLLDASDDRAGAAPRVVISHDYWTRERAADPEVVGSTLRYDGVSYTVVGVAAEGLDFPVGTEAWATVEGSLPPGAEGPAVQAELDLVARLAPGVGIDVALEAVNGALETDPRLQSTTDDLEVRSMPFTTLVLGSIGPMLRAALGASILLLLVAIANATLLFLAGGARTIREGALRRALGATGREVVMPLVADATVRSVAGALLGVGLAHLLVGALVPLAGDEFARFDQVAVDALAVGFAIVLALVSVVGSAGLAGWWLVRRDPGALLGASARHTGHAGHTLRRAIAAGQIALAVLAAVGAGLLWQTVRNLDALDRGFESDDLHLVSLRMPFPFLQVPDGYMEELGPVIERITARPGVEGASFTVNAPLSVRGGIDFVPRLDGQSEEDARANPFIGFDAVTPGYFRLARTDVVQGRAFGPEDGPDDAPTIIVNEEAARLLWPDRSPIGQRIVMGGLSRNETRTVVGVVENHRFRSFPEQRPAAYLPVTQYERLAPSRLLVRADERAGSLRDIVEGAFAASYPGVSVLTVDAMPDVMRRPLLRPRFAAGVLLAFAAVTLALAAIGVHGVFAILVQERRRELGVRMALGAASADLVRFVAVRVLTVGAVGALVGAGASVWASGLIDSLFFGVSAGEPTTVLAVAASAVLVGLLAGAGPALRAVRTDPVESLRSE